MKQKLDLVYGEWKKDGENTFFLQGLTHVTSNTYSKNRAKVSDENFMFDGNFNFAVECQWYTLNKIKKNLLRNTHCVNIYLKISVKLLKNIVVEKSKKCIM